MKAITNIHPVISRFHRAAFPTTAFLTSALLVWCVISGPATAAMLAPKEGEEAGPKVWPANAAQHQVVIKREAADAKQAAMITAAEAAQVSKEVLRQAMEANDRNNSPDLAQQKEAKPPIGDKTWWYAEQLGLRIPCAITGDAITYFSEVISKNAKQVFKSYAMPSSRLEYLAGVQFQKEFKLDEKIFKDVNVVTMKLSFSANFTAEATSGMSFEKKRIVVLDAENKVLHISGDGLTEVPVLML